MPELHEALEHPHTPEDTLTILRKEVELTERDLARALGSTDRSIRRWAAGAPISTEPRQRLYDLSIVIERLSESGLPGPNIHSWLFRRNRFLQDRRPIDVVSDDFDAVAAAAQALLDASYS